MTESIRPAPEGHDRMYIVIVGHVDHGKSTVVGRLLVDTGSLPHGKLEQVKATCERTGRPFEYAFLLDALKDEQAQGITIDVARVFFKTDAREYVIIDAPGHSEFLKNMITGAARAQAALLVIDAHEGVQENSRRHGTMLSLLGIQQVAVLVNKMDLVGWRRETYDAVVREYEAFLTKLGVHPTCFIPTSGRDGDNIAERTAGWYEGPTVLQVLDQFAAPRSPVEGPFRMPVQDVYKFTGQGDDRRIVAGTIAHGTITVGDEVVFYPSAKRSRVKSIERFNAPTKTSAAAGEAAGFTLTEQIYVARGEVATSANDAPPKVTTRIRASVFWLGKTPLVQKTEYLLKLGTAKVPMRLEAVHSVMDASTLGSIERNRVERNEVADCTLALSRPLAVDLRSEMAETSRFVIVDDYEIRGGGIVREALRDRETGVREMVRLRNAKWEPSAIPPNRRAARFAQRPTLLLVTGDTSGDERKSFARKLERFLFDEGRVVYFIGIGNVLYGVDADLERTPQTRQEHFRRLAEVVNLMMDAGFIVVVTAAELTPEDLSVLEAGIPPDLIETIWVGGVPPREVRASIAVAGGDESDETISRIKDMLADKGIVFRAG